jgi:acyl-CoA synthetase (AMP-forming)/AMP-acid ligase II
MYITQSIKRAAQINPLGIATICGDRQQTWKEFQSRISCFAGALHELGVEPEDRISILALNSDRYLEFFYGVPWAGAIMVPMNTRWSVPENIYALEDSGAEILLVDDAFLGHAARIIEGSDAIKTLIYIGDGDTPADMLNYEDLIAAAEPAKDAQRRDMDIAGIFYTGGTTGFPKGVMNTIKSFQYLACVLLSEFDIDQTTRSMHVAPMYHLADAAVGLPTTAAAGTHVFLPSFNPATALQAIAEHGVTHTLLVPTMVKMLLDDPGIDKYDLSSLQRIVYGASPITETVLRNAMGKFPNVGFCQGFGQTETSSAVTVLRPEDHALEGPKHKLLRSAGRAIPGSEVYIVDEDRNEVPRGQSGEIVLRCPNRMLGYWNNPEQTAKSLIDGDIMTGDVGIMDDEGYIFIQDRLKDMIVSGGENVYSAEVENALIQHPAVTDCAVIGIPNDQWGESVHGIVILHEDQNVTAQDLIDHCKELIAGYKCPRSIDFRSDPLPLSGAGKVVKTELRQPFWQDRERGIN